MSTPPINGGWQPKSAAGRLALLIFIAVIILVVIGVFIARH